jgi:hypothetical protein
MLDSVIASIEAKKKDQALAADKFTREQRMLDELAPRLWSQFRLTLRTECEKRHQYFTFRVGPNSGATVICCNRRALDVEYLPASKTIAFRIVNKESDDYIGAYNIGLDENNNAAIFGADSKILPSATYVVDELLTLLLS